MFFFINNLFNIFYTNITFTNFNKIRKLKTKLLIKEGLSYKKILIINSLLSNFQMYINTKLNLNYLYNIILSIYLILSKQILLLIRTYSKTFSFSFYYIQAILFLLFIDSCLIDDEPLWEPIEWSLVQTWILFIFIFGWISENLIVSRYGNYTGRDKRVWMGWYKTFFLIDIYYILNFGATALFVIVPFYFEINFILPFVYSWWNWYSKLFFFKFLFILNIVLFLSYVLQISIRWLNWKKILILVVLINISLSYLLYTHFMINFFGYFTDPLWYQKTRPIDYIQLSHGPSKWGWGTSKKDHFTYHTVRTVFWFKNDGPFVSAFLLFHLYIFLNLFLIYIYWIVLFRRIYSMKEVPLTYVTYCVSTLKQFFYAFLVIYLFVIFSYISQYWRLPIEFFWNLNNTSWFFNFINIILSYNNFIFNYVFL